MLGRLEERAVARGLAIRGVVHDGSESIVLLGPNEPGFWPKFSSSPEYKDGLADPMDRWSKRVIGDLAAAFDASAYFPSDGPPYPPFLRWALDSGWAWPSPVGPLVHAQAGLFLSFRGALRLAGQVSLPTAKARPCETCHAPCHTACPVGAMGLDQAYDTTACKTYLRTPQGRDCLTQGCLVRRSCPTAENFMREPEQSAFHMRAFVKN
ncbi:MAG: ferredoxin [Pelagimonas sp.]|jgi:hypothetical protein|nr:ferredoxin [Pelagimonas sp.]